MSAQHCPRCGALVLTTGLDEIGRKERGCLVCGWTDNPPLSPYVVAILEKEAERSNRSGRG